MKYLHVFLTLIAIVRGSLISTITDPDKVLSVAYDLNSRYVASGGADNVVYVHDLLEEDRDVPFSGHSAWVRSVAFHPSLQWMASGSDDRTVILWDLTDLHKQENSPIDNILSRVDTQEDSPTDNVLFRMDSHTGGVNTVAFHPTLPYIASGSADASVILWDLDSGELIRTITGHTFAVNSVIFSDMNQALISGSSDNTIKVFSLDTGEQIASMEGFTGLHSQVMSIAQVPKTPFIAAGNADNQIDIWDMENQQRIVTLHGHTNSVTSLAFSHDGTRLASGSFDTTIKYWDITANWPISFSGNILTTFEGHASYVSSVVLSPDGQMLASGSYDNTIKLWDLTSASNSPSRTASSSPSRSISGTVSTSKSTTLSTSSSRTATPSVTVSGSVSPTQYSNSLDAGSAFNSAPSILATIFLSTALILAV